MKKIYLILISLLISYYIFPTNYTEGMEYIKIKKNIKNIPQVINFFSFYSSDCFKFEHIYHIPKIIKKNLPKNVKIERYHVNFLGPLGDELTKAWAVATILNIQDKISPLIFKEIKKTTPINDHLINIKKIFNIAGIKNKEYDITLNSIIVKILILKQQQIAKKFKLQSIPATYINGKYLIRNEGIITAKNDNEYAKIYSNIINYLINN